MTNLFLNNEWIKNWIIVPEKLFAKHSDGWEIQYIEKQPNLIECRLIKFPHDIHTKTEEQASKNRDEICEQSKELFHIYHFSKEFMNLCVQK